MLTLGLQYISAADVQEKNGTFGSLYFQKVLDDA